MAVETKQVLHMRFENSFGDTKTLRIPDPRPDLTAAEIQAAMQLVIDNQLYASEAEKLKDAKIVETVTEEFDVIDLV